jgi:hypothetical protein
VVVSKQMVCGRWRGVELFRLSEVMRRERWADEDWVVMVERVRSIPDALVVGVGPEVQVDWSTALQAVVMHGGDSERSRSAMLQFANGLGRDGDWGAPASVTVAYEGRKHGPFDASAFFGKPQADEESHDLAAVADEVRRYMGEAVVSCELKYLPALRGLDDKQVDDALELVCYDGDWAVLRDRLGVRRLRRVTGQGGLLGLDFSVQLGEVADWVAELVHRSQEGMGFKEIATAMPAVPRQVVRLAMPLVLKRQGYAEMPDENGRRMFHDRDDVSRADPKAPHGFARPLSPAAASLARVARNGPHLRVSLAQLRVLRPNLSHDEFEHAVEELAADADYEVAVFEDEQCLAYRGNRGE